MIKYRNHDHYPYVGFSFGGGVQSTALALLIKHEPELLIKKIGHIPNDLFFADTKAEPQKVYVHINLLKKKEILGSNFFIVNSIDLTTPETASLLPLFTDVHGTTGMLSRHCTQDAKIRPVRREMIKQCLSKTGKKPHHKNHVIGQWLGISIDEISRMKSSRHKNTEIIYPLIELNWDRLKCFEYCKQFDITPPKSACYHCPFRSDWLSFSKDNPADFNKACEYDELIRKTPPKGIIYPVYISKTLLPLRESVILKSRQQSLFSDGENECFGYCYT